MNQENNGQTGGDSQPQRSYQPIERIWRWNCDSNGCSRSSREIRLPVGKVPDPCRACGKESFRKIGEGVRPKK